MTKDEKRVAKFLDDLSEESIDTFEAEERVFTVRGIFPEIDWIKALKDARDRQERKDPEANTMRGLLDHMAAELIEDL